MTSRFDTTLSLAVAIAGVALAWSGYRWLTAHRELGVVLQQDKQSARLISEVRHLRSLPAVIEETPIKEDRVLGLVSDCLTQSGINPAAIRDVSTESQAGGTASYRRQNIRVQLDSLSVPDVGRFLSAWNEIHPTWTPTTVNLSPAARNGTVNTAATSEAPPSWSATVVFTSTYLSSQSTVGSFTGSSNESAPPKSATPKRGSLMPERPDR